MKPAAEAMLEMALVENIQREDLDAIGGTELPAIDWRMSAHEETLSEQVGKSDLLYRTLPAIVASARCYSKAIREQEISMGHARALVNIPEPETQIMIYRQIVKYDFSVRKTEEIVRKISSEDGEERYRFPQTLR